MPAAVYAEHRVRQLPCAPRTSYAKPAA